MSTSSKRRSAPATAASWPDWLTLVFGRSGSGKTRWLRDELRSARGNVIAWDPSNGLAGARWDFEGDAWSFLRAQRDARKRIARARVYGDDAGFRAVCEYVSRAGDTTFAVDEAHIFVPQSISNDHPFRLCMVAMRHLQIRLILVAWRPYNVAAYTRSSYSRVLAFSLTDERSLAWLAKETGATAAEIDRVPRLPVGPSRTKPRFLTLRP